jgi:hypothetical protein
LAFEDMASELTGYLPRLAKDFAYTLVNRAWGKIRDDRIWSFQLGEDGMTTPNVITTGTFTVTLGSNIAIADSSATTALSGLFTPSLLTQRQFRIQGYSIYNVITTTIDLNGFLNLTLDRPYADFSGIGLPYQVYQSLYPAPVPDFKRWLDVRDMVNGTWLSIYQTKREVDMGDPQRLYYTFPRWIYGYSFDQRGAGTVNASATLGRMLYELYPNPVSQISYMRWWLRRSPDLVLPSDTLPTPMTEDVVNAKARELAYEWQESNRDPSVARGQTADYKMLMGKAHADYLEEVKKVGKLDRDLVELFLTRVHSYGPRRIPYYSTLLGRAYSG